MLGSEQCWLHHWKKGESFLVHTLFDVGHMQMMLDGMSDVVESNPIVAALNTQENSKALNIVRLMIGDQ